MTATALITGGSKGIGAAIAARLADEGYVLTLAARSQDDLDNTAARLNTEVHTVVADMKREEDVRALAASHRERFGRLDVLVISAGVGTAGPIADMPMRTYERTLDVNLRAPIVLIQETLPMLRAAAAANPKSGAKIIVLSSITGVAGEANLAAYGASKAALISLCETVSLEESARGVAATAISPGYVDTDLSAWKQSELDPSAMLTVDDVAELAMAITHLSANAVVPNIVLSRAGNQLWRA
ncbi:SDR family oxidoreductase [Smaragdicoccus niigatensis]|uniref:SDR family oxidoreductase n=1 Tax=Smaragdicoccus niigatensis TaxID=359359 RepID=UPI000378413F|nr:SDR family oxidoreductase [Smaragdicoccus niigatensis]